MAPRGKMRKGRVRDWIRDEIGNSLPRLVLVHLENFLYFSRCGTMLSIPSRRFLSSS
jgi:hypothetical protein